jgi:hypothetical protein
LLVVFLIAHAEHDSTEMGMITLSNLRGDLNKFLAEINSESDRTTAIVAGAFVQEHLIQLIRSRCVQDEKLHSEMFSPGRAIGDFGVQINLGYMMQIYSRAARKELDTIKYIRNEFAHKIEIDRFDIQSIAARCRNLRIWESWRLTANKPESGEFESGELTINLTKKGSEMDKKVGYEDVLILLEDPKNPISPKVLYAHACKFYIASFSVFINGPIRVPSPVF